MIICKFCRTTVLESGKLWDYHHQDSDSFKGSLRSQCVFCKRLAEGLGEINPWFDHDLKTKSLFRWNMRQVAQIRETKSHVSVTFRPVPGRACGDVKSDDLPEVTFYLFPEEDLGDIPEQHELGNRTDSDASKTQMIDWMQDCIANHPKCIRSHSIKSFIPTRVLDVGPPNTNTNDATPPSHIRVIDSTKEPITGPYMTLSHCWGTGSFIRLTETNVDEYTTNGIPWAELEASNANFVDAVRVVRTLGMRYIWIDSLCIIQGQQHGEDWNHEAPLMHKVYRNSWCNLAAADSKDHTRGLFRERTAEVVPVRCESQEPSVTFGDKVWRILPADLWDRDLLGSHLYTRGWVFQAERMLSPRLLQFTSTQLFWDCATLTATESLPDGLAPPLDTKSATDRHWRERLQSSALSVRPLAGTAEDSLEEFWKSAVAAYTSCDLTYGKDKLAALWGIAKLLRDALGEEYAAGLWGINLAEQLAWRVVDCSTAERYGEKENVVVPGGQAVGNPSWSWTSLKGEVEVAGRVPRLPRFYTACDHGGGNARFQIKKPLFGRFEGEHSTVWREEVVNMTRKLNRASERVSEKARVSGVTTITPIVEDIAEEEVGKDGTPKVATQPETKRGFAMDKPSELLSASLRIQAHLCRGTLEASGAGHWTFTFPGLNQSDALIEAYPDIQPTVNSMSCEMLLLAASKLLQNKWGHWFLDDGYVEDEDIAEVNYSGTGILVERVGEGRYKRVGAVVFRQVKGESWACLRQACGSGGMMLEDELQAEDGEKIWLE
ncbi:heterokaryon incompatibility protein [Colletotrichum lupini]|nr:heterokaryon incompatibility protein [Colletotrichum lupini]